MRSWDSSMKQCGSLLSIHRLSKARQGLAEKLSSTHQHQFSSGSGTIQSRNRSQVFNTKQIQCHLLHKCQQHPPTHKTTLIPNFSRTKISSSDKPSTKWLKRKRKRRVRLKPITPITRRFWSAQGRWRVLNRSYSGMMSLWRRRVVLCLRVFRTKVSQVFSPWLVRWVSPSVHVILTIWSMVTAIVSS
jgi:hypothetical protein